MSRTIPMTLLFLVCCGCGGGVNTDYSKIGLVSLSGMVTLDDQPLANATVIFEATDGTSSFAVTDLDGGYALQFNSERAGVTQGEKTVRISTSQPANDEEIGGEGEDDENFESEDAQLEREDLERVPACYNRESKLNVTVTADTTRMDFKLKSDCSTTGAE